MFGPFLPSANLSGVYSFSLGITLCTHSAFERYAARI